MKLGTSDLNLLVSLGALLEERNVTRAAERLGVSQPTMSGALRRLRGHFGDLLLVRAAGLYELTPLARELATEVPDLLRSIERSFIDRPVFSPPTSNRRFRFLLSDFSVTLIAPALIPVVAAEAPGVELSFEVVQPMSMEDLLERLLEIDFIFMPQGLELGAPSLPVFEDTWACVSGAPHDHRLSTAELAAAEWVTAFGREPASVAAMSALTSIVPRSSYRVTVDNFLLVPHAVLATNRIGLVQRRMLTRIADSLPVYEVDIEADLPPIRESAWWHPSRAVDSGHIWMRHMLRGIAPRV
jgi:DNA-binding transcriptional LysR family regulator